MTRILKIVGGVLAALVALVLIALAVLWRGDIPYATLEQRYAAPTSHYLDLPDGVHLHYRDEGRADGPVLVLVHGFGASAADWDAWAKRLGDTFRIIAPDLPGHGLTRAPKGYQGGPDSQVATVEAMAAALKLPRFVIAGNSMGGGVAWRYALAHPERLNGLVLVDAAGWPPAKAQKQGAIMFRLLANPVTRGIIKNLDNSALVKQGLEAALIDKSLATPALVKRYSDFSRAPGHRDILVGRPRAGSADIATPERLSVIDTPTLVMVGADDRVIPGTDGKRFADAIHGAALIVYPGVGHVPMEQIPDRSAADLRAWLSRLPTTPAAAPPPRTIIVRELPPARPAH
jgi:pimeloyl-ACP methyl ester carboxylesterase